MQDNCLTSPESEIAPRQQEEGRGGQRTTNQFRKCLMSQVRGSSSSSSSGSTCGYQPLRFLPSASAGRCGRRRGSLTTKHDEALRWRGRTGIARERRRYGFYSSPALCNCGLLLLPGLGEEVAQQYEKEARRCAWTIARWEDVCLKRRGGGM
jgi:hypothetical protein